jgi:hypothetical protein
MDMRKRIIFSTVVFGLFNFLLTNCCDSKLINEYTFSPADLKVNPYTGKETLIFNNVGGTSLTFASGSRNSSTETLYKDLSLNEEKKCKGDYFQSEVNVTSFTSTDNELQIKVILYFYPFTDNSTAKKAIGIMADNIHVNSGFGGRDAYFDEDTIYNHGPSVSDSSYIYHDSINLGPKSFTHVYEFNLQASALATIDMVYYSIAEGIVGFDTRNQGIFYLVNQNKNHDLEIN